MVSFYNAVFSIACYYMVVSFVLRYPAGVDHGTDPFAFAVLMAAALLFALSRMAGRAARALRIIALLLPAAALLWNHGMPGILEYTLPWGYLVYLSYRSPRSLSHYYFKIHFSHILWGFIPMLLFLLFQPERGTAALSESVPYFIIFLSAGVLLLQALRHKEEQGKDFVRHQSVQTAVFFLLCILITAGGFLEFLEEVFLQRILRPAGLFLLNGLLGFVEQIWAWLLKKKPKQMEKQVMDYVEKTIERRPIPPAPEPVAAPVKPAENTEINVMLLVVLAVVLAAAVIFIVLRNNTKKHVRQAAVFDEREQLSPEEGSRKKKRQKNAPQELIRESYRKFMKMTDISSHKLKEQDTTQEIREKYMQGKEETKAEEYARELTEIYRMARYREGALDGGGHGFADLDTQKGNARQEAKRMKILLDYLKKV